MKKELSTEKRRRRVRETNSAESFDDEPIQLELFDSDGASQGLVGSDDAWVPPTYDKRYYSVSYAPPPYTDGDSVSIVSLDDSVVDALRCQLNRLDEAAFASLIYGDGQMADILRLNRTSAASMKDLGGVCWYGPFTREIDRLVPIFMDLEPNHSPNTLPSTLHYVLCKLLQNSGYSRVDASYLLQTMMDERCFEQD